ncbi:ribonuclease HII [Patescibacteria group bacterium]|nr:ribonuclease HII [Patescibacteria group bacterium]MBU4000037.1 ribonuclease HII [Patescibacteria group bacterium]MBU4056515.1 ribonuclease HII [Patescibacteria group bacterium]MBU4368927.1 ribonuclease HII [Patescibacteria group bacterium]
MLNPNFDYENKLIKSGFSRICGIDEVGRGPLAGPVVACALTINNSKNFAAEKFKKLKDSKKLSAKQREKWHKILTENEDVKFGIGIVSEKIIDKINILEATKLAMLKALENLARRPASPKLHQGELADKSALTRANRGESASAMLQRDKPDFLLIDGNFILEQIDLNQKAVPRGDEKIISIAAASIIAKVTRDKMMLKYHKKYPDYFFDKHKGYGTKLHFKMIEKHGPCPIHRRSFEPIKSLTFNEF